MIRQNTETTIRGYASKGKLAGVAAPTNRQLAVMNARAWNRSGGTIDVGILRKLHSGKFSLYTYTASGDVYAQVTAAALAAGQVVATTTNNDGFAVQATRPFGMLGVTVSNAATGGTYAAQYWNGSGWASLTSLEVFTDFGSTGDKYLVFLPPIDWAVGGDTGLDSLMYSIRVRHTTAPGDTGAIDAMWLGEFLDFYKGVGNNNAVQVIFDSDRPFILDAQEGLMPYFSTANAANAFGAYYSTL